jgi:hypothetical protein
VTPSPPRSSKLKFRRKRSGYTPALRAICGALGAYGCHGCPRDSLWIGGVPCGCSESGALLSSISYHRSSTSPHSLYSIISMQWGIFLRGTLCGALDASGCRDCSRGAVWVGVVPCALERFKLRGMTRIVTLSRLMMTTPLLFTCEDRPGSLSSGGGGGVVYRTTAAGPLSWTQSHHIACVIPRRMGLKSPCTHVCCHSTSHTGSPR